MSTVFSFHILTDDLYCEYVLNKQRSKVERALENALKSEIFQDPQDGYKIRTSMGFSPGEKLSKKREIQNKMLRLSIT